MKRDEELERLRQENRALHQALAAKDEQIKWLDQEKRLLNEALEKTIQAVKQVRERVKILEEQQAKDSHNSHLPPSSDRFGRRTKRLRQPSSKKRGGQPGHQGHSLKQVEQPDEVLIHRVEECQHCQYALSEQPARVVERCQVIDWLAWRLWVSAHQIEEKRCPVCEHLTRAAFPSHIRASAQYGIGIQALAVYLVQGQMVPYGRASQLLREVFDLQVSPGSLATWVRRCSHELADVETRLKASLAKAPVIHQDETGLRVREHSSWVHVCSTEQLTHYGVHDSCGRQALEAIGILPEFEGTSVHDGYASYPGYDCQHALCTVHHLRELTFVEDVLGQPWAKEMKDVLLEMKAAVEQAKAAGQNKVDVFQVASFHSRYGALIREGFSLNPKGVPPPPAKRAKQSVAYNLLTRLWKHRHEVVRFLQEFAVPFGNNLAERDLRMLKVQQKVSGEFRTDEGAERFCRIRRYLSTVRKQGLPLLTALKQTLAGHPVLPTFSPWHQKGSCRKEHLKREGASKPS